MKTAPMPGGPEVDRLIDVSSDVTLALESLETFTKDSVLRSMEDGLNYGMSKLTQSYSDLTPQQLKVVKACMAEGVNHACEYAVTYIGIHERHLGLCSAQAPAEKAKAGVHDFGKHLNTYWEDVNS